MADVPIEDLYNQIIEQNIRAKSLGGPGLSLQQMYGAVAGSQAARTQEAIARRRLNIEEEAARRTAEAQSAQASAIATQGTAQALMQAPLTYYSGKKMLTDIGVLGATKSSTSSALTEGGGILMKNPATGALTSTGGPATIGEVGYGVYGGAALAGGLAGAYAPLPKQFIPFGGEREKRVTGGAVAGAGAGAIAGGALAGASLTAWSGPGAIVGTVVGAIAGGLSSYFKGGKKGTVICSELLRQGRVSQELLDAEEIYKPNFSWNTYWGYRFWADPVVYGMQKSQLFSNFMALLAIPFLKELAHRIDSRKPKNHFGSFILRVGIPLCKWNYKRVMQKQTLQLLDEFIKVGV